ncbi:unnamed protein product [Closterium sp. NIES-65]|nr:unnamed protein product [Closterium sp. NIES-65]
MLIFDTSCTQTSPSLAFTSVCPPLFPTPPLAIHPSPCHPPLPLPSTLPLAIHPSSCHPPFLLPSTLPLAIHPSSCHPPHLTSTTRHVVQQGRILKIVHTFHKADRSARSVAQGPSPPSSPPLNRPTDPFPSPSPFRATHLSPFRATHLSPHVQHDRSFSKAGLTGPFPSVISALKSLKDLKLPSNSLSGPVPPFLSTLTSLTTLYVPLYYLSVFFISSHTPLFRQLLSCLSTPHTSPYRPALLCIVSYRSESFCRRLDSNQFTGSIPSGLSKLTALTVLQLSNNSLSGSLPSALSTLTNLRNLYSRQQQQAIWIAPFISQILSRNTLSGSIPSDYSALEFLAILLLNNNFIIGTIPSSLSTLSYLYQVGVSENLLSATSLSTLSLSTACPSLSPTDLHCPHIPLSPPLSPLPSPAPQPPHTSNVAFKSLSGSLPNNVAFNSLSGSLPKSLSNLQSLYSLDLSNNYFSGQVQTIFSALTSLQSINISYNYFTGYLPKIGFLGELKSTDLSNNFFFGSANDGTDSIGLPLCPDPPTSSYTIAQNCLLNLANTCTAISGLTVSFVEPQKTEDECFVFCGTSLAMPIFPNQQCGYEKGMCVANLSGSGVLFYQCQCTAPFVRSADAKSCDLPRNPRLVPALPSVFESERQRSALLPVPVHGDPDTARQPQWPQQRGYEKGMCVASLSGDGVLFYQCHQPTTATAISARAPPTLPSPLPTSKIASSFPTVTSEPPS